MDKIKKNKDEINAKLKSHYEMGKFRETRKNTFSDEEIIEIFKNEKIERGIK